MPDWRIPTAAAMFLAASVLPVSPAAALSATPAFDNVIVFGDSLSDIGNVFAATSAVGVPTPGAPYFNGRYSNGQLWVEHVAGLYGIVLKASLNGGTDWAFAGAETTTDRQLQLLPGVSATIPSLKTQVKTYLLSVLERADPNALYVIWGGGNDITQTTSPTTLPAQFAQATAKMVAQLKSAGAKSFFIPNVPDVGVTPLALSTGTGATTTQLAQAMNLALGAALADPTLNAGIKIYHLPTFRALDSIVYSTTHFAFTDVTDACIAGAGSTPCTDPDHTLFWDDFHPSAFGHAMLGIQAEALLPPAVKPGGASS